VIVGASLLAAAVTHRYGHSALPDVTAQVELLPEGYCDAGDVSLPALMDLSDVGIASWAEGLVGRMTPEEKMRLVKGLGWSTSKQEEGWYVGNILGVPRLGIPSLQMQDAAQGFRTTEQAIIGKVTSWPCALALAASWDVKATQRWAQAIGEEFRDKGANVVLGPSVNVHRVALNGRNAEYLSGEDPALGAPLAEAYVLGMQEGAGVAAVVKHFSMNEQETNRETMDAHVDEQTRWEQYYPPFEAAVRAGAAAVMCSYNYVNGKQACSSSHALSDELKGMMGFGGFVMTDWWALKDVNGALSGADQEQPGSRGFFSLEVLQTLPPGRLDDMVGRVLRGMARGSRVWRESQNPCRVGCSCRRLLSEAVATSPQHVALARELAAGGAVLLKNSPRLLTRGPTLPLRNGETIAVLGSVCAIQEQPEAMAADWLARDYYVVGGSGRVLSPRTVSVLQGLKSRGVVIRESPSEDLAAAQAAVNGADVALVCAGATSAESQDRTTLRLDQEDFISKVQDLAAAPQIPVVVVALVPGAIVAPWRRGAAAVLAFFLSGQETGNAVADVLLGTVTPSGKLPVTFPEEESDAIQPCMQQTCKYSERLFGGWHVYDGKPVAYPFGHGLSYAQFEFLVASDWSTPSVYDGARSLSIRVHNVGDAKGAEVVQLYLAFPLPEEARPRLSLRGFQKTPVLMPGESCEVLFRLGPRDLSVWDVDQHGWRLVSGRFLTKVGSSSRDLRLCGGFEAEDVQPMVPC